MFDRWLSTIPPREIPILERVDFALTSQTLDSLWRIDGQSQRIPLSRSEIRRLLRKGKLSITAARLHGQIVGVLYWEETPGFLHLTRMGVLQEHRRKGIGSLLVNDVCQRRLNLKRRSALVVFEHLPEYDAAAAMLSRKCQFLGKLSATAGHDFLTFTRVFGGSK